jgi:hypothetical protein
MLDTSQIYLDVLNHPKLKNLSSIEKLCRGLIETKKIRDILYYL